MSEIKYPNIYVLNNAPCENDLTKREFLVFNPEEQIQTKKVCTIEKMKGIVNTFGFTLISPIECDTKGYFEYRKVKNIAYLLPLPF
jgi:hypothetical protein